MALQSSLNSSIFFNVGIFEPSVLILSKGSISVWNDALEPGKQGMDQKASMMPANTLEALGPSPSVSALQCTPAPCC